MVKQQGNGIYPLLAGKLSVLLPGVFATLRACGTLNLTPLLRVRYFIIVEGDSAICSRRSQGQIMEREKELTKLINVLRRTARMTLQPELTGSSQDAAAYCTDQYNRVLTAERDRSEREHCV
jgi:hypothetical protein